MLRQASAKVLRAGSPAVDLDETGLGREPTQETETVTLGFARRVGSVTEIGVLGHRVDLLVHEGRPGSAEGFLAEVLGESIEVISTHELPGVCERGAPSNDNQREVSAQEPEPDLSCDGKRSLPHRVKRVQARLTPRCSA